jgi:hypothetical protein
VLASPRANRCWHPPSMVRAAMRRTPLSGSREARVSRSRDGRARRARDARASVRTTLDSTKSGCVQRAWICGRLTNPSVPGAHQARTTAELAFRPRSSTRKSIERPRGQQSSPDGRVDIDRACPAFARGRQSPERGASHPPSRRGHGRRSRVRRGGSRRLTIGASPWVRLIRGA